jgi:hypothetical protein
MLFALLEKLAFAIPMFMLAASGRVAGCVVVFGPVDLVWVVSFASLWIATGKAAREVGL